MARTGRVLNTGRTRNGEVQGSMGMGTEAGLGARVGGGGLTGTRHGPGCLVKAQPRVSCRAWPGLREMGVLLLGRTPPGGVWSTDGCLPERVVRWGWAMGGFTVSIAPSVFSFLVWCLCFPIFGIKKWRK